MDVSKPKILLLGGKDARARAIQTALASLDVTLARAAWDEGWWRELDGETAAVVLVEPLSRGSTSGAVRRIRQRVGHRSMAVIVVVQGEIRDSQARRVYGAGADVVVEWPKEGSLFPNLVAEMSAFQQVRGKPTDSDNALARSIEAHLKSVPGLGRKIRVQARHGVASLTGRVDSLWKKTKLEQMVSNVPGVTRVVTGSLHVSHSGLPDREIARAVRAALRDAPDVDKRTISVGVRNGRVSLAGSAADRMEVRRLDEIVRNVKGVRDVDNLVVVSLRQKEKDSVVARRSTKSVSSHFPEVDVSVSVFGGVAVLSGHVPSLRVKGWIEELVAGDRAVSRVINKLAVG